MLMAGLLAPAEAEAQEFLALATTTTTTMQYMLLEPWVNNPEPIVWPQLPLLDLAATLRPTARIPQGGAVRLFAIGSSNLLWETWLEQLHLLLTRLEYQVPLVDSKGLIKNRTRPDATARCDDIEALDALATLRIAKPGWASWGFAFEDQADCNAAGFRPFLGHSVSCTNGWQCNPDLTGSDAFIRPSVVAEVAKDADVVVLSNWVNDFTMRFQGNACFEGGEVLPPEDVSLTVASLLTLIRAIHAANPEVAVVVMAKYPGAIGKMTGPVYTAINSAVRLQLIGEPKTYFVDFNFPTDEPMFLASRSGHPNCRGDRLFAQGIVNVLFKAGIINRGVATAKEEDCPIFAGCESYSGREDCCQAKAECWVNEGLCLNYSEGEP